MLLNPGLSQIKTSYAKEPNQQSKYQIRQNREYIYISKHAFLEALSHL